MNEDQFRGSWYQITASVKEKWNHLTDDDLMMIAGRRDQLIGKLWERYGMDRAEAERQFREFLGSCELPEERRRAA